MRAAPVLLPLLLLPGCLAKTAVDVVTLPVRAVGAGVDAVTTSQSEADEKRGRQMRKQEERDRKAAKKAEEERIRLEREQMRTHEGGR